MDCALEPNGPVAEAVGCLRTQKTGRLATTEDSTMSFCSTLSCRGCATVWICDNVSP